MISRPASKPSSDDDPRRVDHRRDAPLHVLRAAAVQAAVALDRIERSGHPFHADGVDVAAEHQRAPRPASLRARRSHSTGPAGPAASRHRVRGDGGARRSRRAISVSPAAPGTSDGFTELMATSSRRSLRAGIRFGARCSVLGAQCSVLGARCSVLSARVLGARCSVLGARCSVLGARCSVLGARCSVLRGARCSVLGARCSVLGARWLGAQCFSARTHSIV